MDYDYELDIDSLFYNREANEVIIKTTDKKHQQVLIKIPITSLEEIMNRIEIKKREGEEVEDEKVFHTPISSEYMSSVTNSSNYDTTYYYSQKTNRRREKENR